MTQPAGDSSRRKRSRKADTPGPSTTSGIIAGEGPSSTDTIPFPSPPEKEQGEKHHAPATADPVELPAAELTVMTPEQQAAVIQWMQKGAAPGAACQQQGLTVEHFWFTLANDPAFNRALQQLFDTLSQNVLVALYQAAMKGQVTAQQFWLRHRPATLWTTQTETTSTDPLQQLNDDQLVDEFRAAGLDLPPEVAARVDPSQRNA